VCTLFYFIILYFITIFILIIDDFRNVCQWMNMYCKRIKNHSRSAEIVEHSTGGAPEDSFTFSVKRFSSDSSFYDCMQSDQEFWFLTNIQLSFIYIVSEKRCHYIFASNFAKCRPIFKWNVQFYLKHVATFKMYVLKNRHVVELIGANCHAKLSRSRQMLENIHPVMLATKCLRTRSAFRQSLTAWLGESQVVVKTPVW